MTSRGKLQKILREMNPAPVRKTKCPGKFAVATWDAVIFILGLELVITANYFLHWFLIWCGPLTVCDRWVGTMMVTMLTTSGLIRMVLMYLGFRLEARNK
jgi:hypothetical protein